jgi:hypothetical protein
VNCYLTLGRFPVPVAASICTIFAGFKSASAQTIALELIQAEGYSRIAIRAGLDEKEVKAILMLALLVLGFISVWIARSVTVPLNHAVNKDSAGRRCR